MRVLTIINDNEQWIRNAIAEFKPNIIVGPEKWKSLCLGMVYHTSAVEVDKFLGKTKVERKSV